MIDLSWLREQHQECIEHALFAGHRACGWWLRLFAIKEREFWLAEQAFWQDQAEKWARLTEKHLHAGL